MIVVDSDYLNFLSTKVKIEFSSEKDNEKFVNKVNNMLSIVEELDNYKI